MSFEELISMDTENFFEWITYNFNTDMIDAVETEDDMRQASKMISRAIGNYSYLSSLLAYLKIKVRQEKRNKNKEICEDLIDKREVVQEMVDATKMLYNGISRMVTIKIEIDKEMSMTDFKTGKN